MKQKFHVPGHWVTKIKRGKLPLSLEDRQKLIQAHYQVFTTRTQSPACKAALEKAATGNARLQRDEWVAIRRIWREPFVRTVGTDAD